MAPPELSGDELVDALIAPVEPAFAGQVVVAGAPPAAPDDARVEPALRRLATLPCLVIGTAAWADAHAVDLVDVTVADADELGAVLDSAGRSPLSTLALALHLRASARRGIADGLVAESAAFSALQAGPEHRRWRAATPRRRPHGGPDVGDRVRVRRAGDQLAVTLQRPDVRNALDARMRDELLDALAVAEADPALHVVLRGDGPVFCAGGDLDEFGARPDPATAHVLRVQRSIGAVLARLAPRTTVHLQGACAGSGVELAAFAGRVVAAEDTTLALPELALGLIPGAGGTVSLPARIGRHRTAWLALTGWPVDAPTARSWGLVDEIDLF